MRGTKKLLALTICIALVLTLSACGGSAATPSGGSAVPTPSGSSPNQWPATTIEYWHINSETQGGPTVEKLIETFNKTNGKNITVVGKFTSNAYQGVAENLQAALAIGEYPGVVQVGWNYLNYFAENFPQFTSPKEIIETYAPEDAGFLEKHLFDNIRDLSISAEGVMLGLPYATSTPVMFINADLFKQAGLDPETPPRTLKEAIAAGQQIKDKTGNEGFYIEVIANTYALNPLMLSTGAEMYEMKDGKTTATFYTPEVVDVFTTWQNGFKSGACTNIGSEEALGAFASGKIGMLIATVGKSNYMQSSCNFDLRTAPYPTSGDSYSLCVGGNMLVCVGGNADEIRACWEFMKFLYEDDNMADWVMGTGYLPTTKTAADNSPKLKTFLAENKLLQPAINTFGNAVAWTSWPGPNGLQVDQILIDMRDAIISNYADPDATIKKAQEDINALLR